SSTARVNSVGPATLAYRARRGFEISGRGEAEQDMRSCGAPLQLGGRAFGNDAPMVEHGDPVGEPISLVGVLGGQEDRHTVFDDFADDLPHRVPAARVQP